MQHKNFSLTAEGTEHGYILHIKGTFGGATMRAIKEEVDSGLATNHIHFIFDLEKTTFLDSSAIGMLMNLHKRLLESDGGVCLAAVPPGIYRSLDATNVLRVINAFASLDEALARVDRTVEKEERGIYCLIWIRGDFNINALKKVRDAVEEAIGIGHTHIGFNLEHTTSIGSVGIGLLMNVQKRLHEQGGGIFLVSIPQQIRQSLQTSNALSVLTEYHDLDEADTSVT
jgi:anti-anti-sigma factor